VQWQQYSLGLSLVAAATAGVGMSSPPSSTTSTKLMSSTGTQFDVLLVEDVKVSQKVRRATPV
jgi:hypothetical protein